MTDITANDGTWTFLCVTWSSIDGLWVIYVNGEVIDRGEKLSEGQEISNGGILVVGQEQDSPGGHFSAAESFKGQLTRLNMWSRILTEDEVHEVMNSCIGKSYV